MEDIEDSEDIPEISDVWGEAIDLVDGPAACGTEMFSE